MDLYTWQQIFIAPLMIFHGNSALLYLHSLLNQPGYEAFIRALQQNL